MSKINETGKRYGRLVVWEEAGRNNKKSVLWLCQCDCGEKTIVSGDALRSGTTISCGCYHREKVIAASSVHGMAGRKETHPVYHTWSNMLQRCENPSNPSYKNYGGRGITVCPGWHDAKVFINWSLANGWQEGLTLDRINNNGNYEPSNCRWVTRKVQARNMRANRLITFNGKTQSLADWAEEAGISYSALLARIYRYHWPIERALTEPIHR